MNDAWPSEIRLSTDKKTLSVMFEGGESMTLSAELLRVESPPAEVQGHGVGQQTPPLGKRDVRITGLEPVGNYAVRLTFDDGPNTGIYSWDILQDYGRRQDSLMADYRDRAAGR